MFVSLLVSISSDKFGILPGIVYCVIIALVSYWVWGFYKPVSSMMWAFIISIILANAFSLRSTLKNGVNFCSGPLLRFTVAALGFVTSALIWTRVGVGVFAAFLVIFVSIFLSLFLGAKLGLDQRLSSLIGAGTAICGASAIAALSPAINAKEEESGLAVSGITLFGLFSMFLYPFLFMNTPVNGILGASLDSYAVWVGAGIHETAQVIAAAGAVDASVVQAAMLIKSVRIFMIGPVVFLLAWYCSRGKNEGKKTHFTIPLFTLAFTVGTFVCAILDINASVLLQTGFDWLSLKPILSGTILPFAFATAFAGVGSKVSFSSILKLGVKPILLAASVAVTAGILAFISAALFTIFVV
jgi:uncharacterized integral membrane protein (TIGR00698 family)